MAPVSGVGNAEKRIRGINIHRTPRLLWQSGGIDVYGATFGSSFRLRLRVR
jgi:hypothetical protein